MKNKTNIAMQELRLNIKHQNIQVEKYLSIGYQFNDKLYIFHLIIPNIFVKKNKNKKK